MGEIGFFVGAVIGVFLASRLLWFGARSWQDSLRKAIYINAVSALILIPLAAIGGADGGPPRLGESFVIYGLAQIIVLFIDILRLKRGRTRVDEPAE